MPGRRHCVCPYTPRVPIAAPSIPDAGIGPQPKMKNNQNTTIFVYLNSTNFHLIATQNNYLKICNTFVHETAEDFLYYIMFTAEQLQLNPEKFQLFLLGDIHIDHSYYQIAHKYIRNTELLHTSSTQNNTDRVIYHKDFIFINRL